MRDPDWGPDDVTIKGAVKEGIRWGVISVVVVAIIFLVGWQVGGWFQKHDIQRNYSNTVNSQSYQQGLLSQMQAHLDNISGPDGLAATRASLPAASGEQQVIRAQELNEVKGFCSESAQFDPSAVPGGQQMEAVITANCLAGVPVAEPPLADPIPQGASS